MRSAVNYPHRIKNDDFAPRIPGKNVYILGSGFSAPLGIPTIACFISSGLRLLKTDRWPSKSRLRTITNVLSILRRYGQMLRSVLVHDGEPNLEDYFCAIDAAGNRADRQSLAAFVCDVCLAAWSRHAEICKSSGKQMPDEHNDHFLPGVPRDRAWLEPVSPWQGPSGPMACIYEAFLAQVFVEADRVAARADAMPAIVSMNYDLVLERKRQGLEAFERGAVKSQRRRWHARQFDYGRSFAPNGSAKTLVPLIKLHGSLNWVAASRRGAGVRIKASPPHGVTAHSETLIMPSWVRGPVDGGLSGALIDDALFHLRLADRIVIIGYSMPDSDQYFRFLMARALDTPEMPNAIEIHSKLPRELAESRAKRMFGAAAPIITPPDQSDLASFLGSRSRPS